MAEKRKLYHPQLDTTITVFASAVPVHMASGWQPVEDEPQQAAAQTRTASQDKPRSKRRSTESEE